MFSYHSLVCTNMMCIQPSARDDDEYADDDDRLPHIAFLKGKHAQHVPAHTSCFQVDSITKPDQPFAPFTPGTQVAYTLVT